MSPRRSTAGISLIEMAITLAVMSMLAAVLAPPASGLIEQSRQLQAQRDCATIRDAMIRLLLDVNKTRFVTHATGGHVVELLVSGGTIPSTSGRGDARWARDLTATGEVDLLERHLVTNDPAGDPARGWAPPASAGGSGWRGAYVAVAINADPWGHRYAVNAKYFGSRRDVVVISAGPNGLIETPFEGQPIDAARDDRLVLIR